LQLRIWVAAIIFIGSYLPLAVILLAQDFDYTHVDSGFCYRFWIENTDCNLPLKHPWISLSLVGLAAVCFVASLIILSTARPKRSVTISSAKYVPAELMNYTLPYVVSFMGVGYQDTGKFVGVLVFLVWIFWITHRSGQIILNPVLIALGWRLYEVAYEFKGDDVGHHSLVLARAHVEAGSNYKYALIQDVMVIKPSTEE